MKTTSITVLTIFLIMALSYIIAQEFAIHLLYNRCETLRSEYDQLVMSKTKILFIPYKVSEPAPAYFPIEPHAESLTLASKNKNQLNIK